MDVNPNQFHNSVQVIRTHHLHNIDDVRSSISFIRDNYPKDLRILKQHLDVEWFTSTSTILNECVRQDVTTFGLCISMLRNLLTRLKKSVVLKPRVLEHFPIENFKEYSTIIPKLEIIYPNPSKTTDDNMSFEENLVEESLLDNPIVADLEDFPAMLRSSSSHPPLPMQLDTLHRPVSILSRTVTPTHVKPLTLEKVESLRNILRQPPVNSSESDETRPVLSPRQRRRKTGRGRTKLRMTVVKDDSSDTDKTRHLDTSFIGTVGFDGDLSEFTETGMLKDEDEMGEGNEIMKETEAGVDIVEREEKEEIAEFRPVRKRQICADDLDSLSDTEDVNESDPSSKEAVKRILSKRSLRPPIFTPHSPLVRHRCHSLHYFPERSPCHSHSFPPASLQISPHLSQHLSPPLSPLLSSALAQPPQITQVNHIPPEIESQSHLPVPQTFNALPFFFTALFAAFSQQFLIPKADASTQTDPSPATINHHPSQSLRDNRHQGSLLYQSPHRGIFSPVSTPPLQLSQSFVETQDPQTTTPDRLPLRPPIPIRGVTETPSQPLFFSDFTFNRSEMTVQSSPHRTPSRHTYAQHMRMFSPSLSQPGSSQLQLFTPDTPPRTAFSQHVRNLVNQSTPKHSQSQTPFTESPFTHNSQLSVLSQFRAHRQTVDIESAIKKLERRTIRSSKKRKNQAGDSQRNTLDESQPDQSSIPMVGTVDKLFTKPVGRTKPDRKPKREHRIVQYYTFVEEQRGDFFVGMDYGKRLFIERRKKKKGFRIGNVRQALLSIHSHQTTLAQGNELQFRFGSVQEAFDNLVGHRRIVLEQDGENSGQDVGNEEDENQDETLWGKASRKPRHWH
ncbi:hypothetical protein BLNAU_1676 [Blattamonas nauphoetae]|uniref:SPK domain-containing protein n=1 Tax=Blattamonas nauphoetae TaxID=2049346 RepID=A0ABQ9YHE7_9EUKA|nr:hypothetical protein BLNAU_1676 [Blattamonas nauphoetae]